MKTAANKQDQIQKIVSACCDEVEQIEYAVRELVQAEHGKVTQKALVETLADMTMDRVSDQISFKGLNLKEVTHAVEQAIAKMY